MSVSSDETEVDESWKVNLEIALLEDADIFRIREICEMRPVPDNLRPDVWRICLRLDTQSQTMAEFNDVFELENQSQLHDDCELASAELFQRLTKEHNLQAKNHSSLSINSDNDDLDVEASSLSSFLPPAAKISNDFESVLTHFAETYSLKYSSSNGWVSIIKVLYTVLKPTNRSELYMSFVSFYHRFVATGVNVDQCVSMIFRLLLQYHEPKLCSFLDSLKISPEDYFIPWISSLFADYISEDVIPSLWDVYFLKSDPLLGFYIGLLLIINAKSFLLDQCLNKTEDDQKESQAENLMSPTSNRVSIEKVKKKLIDLPKPMRVSDLTSLIDLTEVFINNTPVSFRSRYLPILFGNAQLESERTVLSESLCMSITIQEVLDAQSMYLQEYGVSNSSITLPDETSDLRYLLVDCRPAEQYNAGHLPTAFFLDSSLIMSEPLKFQNAVKILLSTQERSLAAGSYAVGKHITFLSSGRAEDDQLANMVVAEFLRQNTPYISLIEGGYAALHEVLGAYEVGRSLIGHEPTICLGCINKKNFISPPSVPLDSKIESSPLLHDKAKAQMSNSPSVGLFSKFSSAILSTGRSLDQVPKLLKLPGVSNVSPMQKKTLNTQTTIVNQPVREKDTKKSVAYRNTSSVFSIDDDYDEDDVCEDETENTVKTPTSTESVLKNDASSGQSTWLKRFVKSSAQVSPTMEGDFPCRIGGMDSCEAGDLIDTTQWSRRPEVRGVFNTQFIKHNGQLGDHGLLVLAERHLVLLRHPTPGLSNQLINSLSSTLQSVFNKKNSKVFQDSAVQKSITNLPRHAVVYRSIPLSLIVRITSNRRFPECITFHYCPRDESDMLKLDDQSSLGMKDRLFINEAGEAVKMVKTAIFTTVGQLER
ncbi:unnamed protein product [Trichobilharzia szidati]|nr:unnamed protein product [Trichobilharzia szidati]